AVRPLHMYFEVFSFLVKCPCALPQRYVTSLCSFAILRTRSCRGRIGHTLLIVSSMQVRPCLQTAQHCCSAGWKTDVAYPIFALPALETAWMAGKLIVNRR